MWVKGGWGGDVGEWGLLVGVMTIISSSQITWSLFALLLRSRDSSSVWPKRRKADWLDPKPLTSSFCCVLQRYALSNQAILVLLSSSVHAQNSMSLGGHWLYINCCALTVITLRIIGTLTQWRFGCRLPSFDVWWMRDCDLQCLLSLEYLTALDNVCGFQCLLSLECQRSKESRRVTFHRRFSHSLKDSVTTKDSTSLLSFWLLRLTSFLSID